MKNKYQVIIVFIIGLVLSQMFIACGTDDDDDNVPPKEEEQIPSEEEPTPSEEEPMIKSGGVVQLGAFGATVSGSFNPEKISGNNFQLGVAYSVSNSQPTMEHGFVGTNDVINTNSFQVALSSLKPATTYYYRACIIQGGLRYYGDVCSFVTNEFTDITCKAVDVHPLFANLEYTINIKELKNYDYTSGIVYSASESIPEVGNANCLVWQVGDSHGISPTGILTVGNTQTVSFKINGLKPETTYYCRGFVCIDGERYYGETMTFTTVVPQTQWDIVQNGAVDMGLSVKWSATNVGAASPELFGEYYAWGETETKCEFTKENYQASIAGIENIGGTSHDVAYVKLGDGWRMPTIDEFQELRDKCTWTWTWYNGVSGYIVTSTLNGNSIFLPAGGFRYESSVIYEYQAGDYWTSICSKSNRNPKLAYAVDFYEGDVTIGTWECDGGMLVRPVFVIEE